MTWILHARPGWVFLAQPLLLPCQAAVWWGQGCSQHPHPCCCQTCPVLCTPPVTAVPLCHPGKVLNPPLVHVMSCLATRAIFWTHELLLEHGDTPSYHMLTKSGAHSENLTPYAAVFPLQIFYRSISDVRVTSEHRKGMEKKDANQPRVAGTFQTNTWLDGKFSAGVSSALGAWEAGRQSMLAGEVGAPRGDSLPAQEHHPF